MRIHQLDKGPADLKCASKAIEESKLASKGQFEKQFQHRLHTKSLGKGQLVLIRNSVCNTGLVNKYTPRYSGPYIIHRETKAGVYVLKELDGTFMRQAVASFRLLPYLPRVPGDLLNQQIADFFEEGTDSNQALTSSISDESTDSDDLDF